MSGKKSEHFAKISWTRGRGEKFSDNKYSRAHTWRFDGGATVAASPSPHNVPLPYSAAENVDPEEAFVAAIASCHMLFFLHFAAAAGLVVESYADDAVGVLEDDQHGRMAITRITLRPQIKFKDNAPSRQDLDALHARAHRFCFLANSVKSEVVVVGSA